MGASGRLLLDVVPYRNGQSPQRLPTSISPRRLFVITPPQPATQDSFGTCSYNRHGGSSSRITLSDDGFRERSARSVQARQLCATGFGYASQLPCRFQGLDQS